MKIAVLGIPRTRSSYLIDVVSNNFNLNNQFEIYQDLQGGCWNSKNWTNKENYWELYKNKIITVTNDLFEKNNFSIKIFSNVLLSPDYKCIFEDIQFLRLNEYNTIYYLYRDNIYDLIISQLTARRNKKFLYSKEDLINLDTYYYSLDLLQNKILREIDYILITITIHKKIKEYLLRKNINFIELEYQEIPTYITNNFSNVETIYKEHNINYSYVKNYKEVCEYIDYRKNYLANVSNSHEFK